MEPFSDRSEAKRVILETNWPCFRSGKKIIYSRLELFTQMIFDKFEAPKLFLNVTPLLILVTQIHLPALIDLFELVVET